MVVCGRAVMMRLNMNEKLRDVLFVLVFLLVISSYPAAFLYTQNIRESMAHEMIKPIALFWGVGIASFAVSVMVTKDGAPEIDEIKKGRWK